MSKTYKIINKVDLKFSDKAKISMENADNLVREYKRKILTSDSILFGLLTSNSPIASFLEENGFDLLDLKNQITNKLTLPQLNQSEQLKPPKTRNKKFNNNKKIPFEVARSIYSIDSINLGRVPVLKTSETDDLILNKIFNNIESVDNPELTSEKLFQSVLELPFCWKIFNDNNISVNKLSKYFKNLNLFETNPDIQKLIITTENDKFQVLPYDIIGASNFKDGISERTAPFKLFYTNVNNFIYVDQVVEFEWLINKPNVSEFDIQKFLERNPGFLLNMEYKSLHAQITLARENLSDLRPDFMLERIDCPLCDIIDLKKPNVNLVVGSQNRRTFSYQVISALSQLSTYRDYFDNPNNRKMFYEKYGFQAYKPKISVVIGRSQSFNSEIERRELEMLLPNLNIVTYDDILARAKYRCLI